MYKTLSGVLFFKPVTFTSEDSKRLEKIKIKGNMYLIQKILTEKII